MSRSRTGSGGALLLASLVLGCGSDGAAPSEEPVLRDHLVFESLGRIGVIDPDGSQPQFLPTGDDLEYAANPVVSPDGRRIAFAGLRNDQWDLYVIRADGSERKQVTDDAGSDGGPTWSPGGDSLMFVWAASFSSPGVLTVIAADGGGRRELLLWAQGGAWSPDGLRAVFPGYGPRDAGIYVTDLAGSEVTPLAGGCGDSCRDFPTRWSPDGQYLGFTRLLPGAGGEAAGIMRADGSDRRLLFPGLQTSGTVWSPDGQRVAVTRWDGAEETYSIYVLTLATGLITELQVPFAFVSDWAR